jgi:hypothetical protein
MQHLKRRDSRRYSFKAAAKSSAALLAVSLIGLNAARQARWRSVIGVAFILGEFVEMKPLVEQPTAITGKHADSFRVFVSFSGQAGAIEPCKEK